MNKDDLNYMHGKVEHKESEQPKESKLDAMSLPEGVNILNASNEELDNLEVVKDEKEVKDVEEVLQEADGKNRSEKKQQIAQAKELEDLLAIKDANPYKTLNEDIFEENLSSMSVAEMTMLATRVGINPSGSRSQLKKSLIQSFKFYAQKHNVNVASQAKPIELDKNDPNYEESVRLFKDI